MRKPNRPKKNKLFQVSVQMPGALALKVDAKADKLSTAKKIVSRSAVVRMAIEKFVR